MKVDDLTASGVADAATAVTGTQFLQYVTRWQMGNTIYYAMMETTPAAAAARPVHVLRRAGPEQRRLLGVRVRPACRLLPGGAPLLDCHGSASAMSAILSAHNGSEDSATLTPCSVVPWKNGPVDATYSCAICWAAAATPCASDA